MKRKQPDPSQKKRKILHAKVRLWWVIGWLVAFTVLLIYYWSDLQKALSAK